MHRCYDLLQHYFKLSSSPDSTILQLCPLRSAFIHTTTLILGIHTAARLIKYLSPRDHVTPRLKQLHWLPLHASIAFKISLLMYHIHSGTSPSYMSSMVTPYALLPGPEDSDQQRVGILL